MSGKAILFCILTAIAGAWLLVGSPVPRWLMVDMAPNPEIPTFVDAASAQKGANVDTPARSNARYAALMKSQARHLEVLGGRLEDSPCSRSNFDELILASEVYEKWLHNYGRKMTASEVESALREVRNTLHAALVRGLVAVNELPVDFQAEFRDEATGFPAQQARYYRQCRAQTKD